MFHPVFFFSWKGGLAVTLADVVGAQIMTESGLKLNCIMEQGQLCRRQQEIPS